MLQPMNCYSLNRQRLWRPATSALNRLTDLGVAYAGGSWGKEAIAARHSCLWSSNHMTGLVITIVADKKRLCCICLPYQSLLIRSWPRCNIAFCMFCSWTRLATADLERRAGELSICSDRPLRSDTLILVHYNAYTLKRAIRIGHKNHSCLESFRGSKRFWVTIFALTRLRRLLMPHDIWW